MLKGDTSIIQSVPHSVYMPFFSALYFRFFLLSSTRGIHTGSKQTTFKNRAVFMSTNQLRKEVSMVFPCSADSLFRNCGEKKYRGNSRKKNVYWTNETDRKRTLAIFLEEWPMSILIIVSSPSDCIQFTVYLFAMVIFDSDKYTYLNSLYIFIKINSSL